MKLIITIIPQKDSNPVSQALTEKIFRVTKIASTGGFLRKGNATMLV
ncbi:MAG: cyclic-di-AMP receptor, partial [Anaerolineaceae bacterium]|nr:cyclic-di-AMP receptor [Anaerolineaceae bacterium]